MKQQVGELRTLVTGAGIDPKWANAATPGFQLTICMVNLVERGAHQYFSIATIAPEWETMSRPRRGRWSSDSWARASFTSSSRAWPCL